MYNKTKGTLVKNAAQAIRLLIRSVRYNSGTVGDPSRAYAWIFGLWTACDPTTDGAIMTFAIVSFALFLLLTR